MLDAEARTRAARHAVADASAVCRAVQADLAAVQAELKDDRSPVTVADWASQAVVVRRLREELGEEVVIGEEDASALRGAKQGALRERVLRAVHLVWSDADIDDVIDAIDCAGPDDREGGADAFWTLDPIDGTKGFLRGEQYAVSLAWVRERRPQVASLGCPNLSADFERPFAEPDRHGLIFWAASGAGVTQVPADAVDGPAQPLQRVERAADDTFRICQSVEREHTNRGATAQILEHMGIQTRPARLDSQAKYAVVARGQADAYLRMPSRKGYVERIWDHAAGALIAQEARCHVTDIRGRELDFGHGRGLEANLGVICACDQLHDRLLRAVRELGLDKGPVE